jgi:DNA-binding SARP family transcriptional activator
MDRLILKLFGGFEARLGSGRTIALPRRKARALLACMSLRPALACSRATLLALLWGDVPGAQARHSLRQTLLDLRRALPHGRSPILLVEGDTLTLNPRRVEIDACELERLAKLGTRKALERAAALYTGDLLAGLALREPPFEEWLRAERDRLRETALRVLGQLLLAQTSAADLEAAIETAMRYLTIDPLHEPVHRDLIQLYNRLGRRSAALRQYHLCTEVLQRELGMAPEPETRRLYESLAPKPPTAARTEPTRAGRRMPPKRELANGGQVDVPVVGRQIELEQLSAAARDAARGHGGLIVIRGEAGIGKSCLLRELASLACRLGLKPLLGPCFEVTNVLAFSPWVEALRGAGVADDRDLSDQIGVTWRAELSRLIPEFIQPGLQSFGQPEDHLRLFEAVAHVMEQMALRQPLLVMIEDLQWADNMSVCLLFYLARRLKAAPVLLAITVRDGELPEGNTVHQMLKDLERDQRATSFSLTALSKSECAALVRAVCRPDSSSVGIDELGEEVWRMSHGNPRTIMETLRALPFSAMDPASSRRWNGLPSVVTAAVTGP